MDDFWTTILMVMVATLTVLNIRKASFILQSDHKPRRLDFIFDLFMECGKFIFYSCFYVFSLLNMNVSRETWLKNGHQHAPS